MDSPLEIFLKDLANKIQTAKEYKEIVQDSQNVDVNKNVFEGFITGIAETIKKELQDKTDTPSVSSIQIETQPEEDSFVKFVSTLANTISANKNKPVEIKPEPPNPAEENEEKQQPEPLKQPEPDSFGKFIGNLKDIINKKPIETKQEQPKKPSKPNDYVSELKKENDPVKPKTKDDQIKDLVRKFVEGEIKNFKDEVTLKINQVGSSYGGGGGTNAVQYANGGTMNGNLNVNGQILSGGVDLANIFGAGGTVNLGDIPVLSGNWNSTYSTVYTNSASWGSGGVPQTLSFNETNAQLSLSFGNTVSLSALSGTQSVPGDSAVNTLVHNNSAYWNEAYTNLVNNSAAYLLSGTEVNLGDIPVLSGYWNTAYTNLVNNSAAYLLSGSVVDLGEIPVLSGYWNEAYTNLVNNSAVYLLSGTEVNLGDIPFLSGNWNSVYTSVNDNSAYWADTRQDVIFGQNVTINANLTALGTSTFKNTIFTTTSALSVINTGPGPALYVFQAAGPSDVASFYDGDGVEVLHVGNANTGQGGKVGINESFPGAELTVNGAISSNSSVSVVSVQASNSLGVGTYAPLYFNLDVNGAIGNGTIGSSYGNLGLGASGDILINPNNNLLLGPVGNVGIGTNAPTEKLTVSGNVSAGGVITATGGDSNKWNSAYTTVQNNSSTVWNYQGTDIKALTGKYESTYTTTNINSAFWSQAYTNLISNSSAYLSGVDISLLTVTSGSWNSVYTSVRNNSSFWNDVYNNVAITSAARDSVYSTTRNNSAGWGSVYTSFNTNSARYDSSWTTVNSNSASWGGGGANTKYDSVWTTTNSNSSNWSTAYTNLVSNSATYSGTTRQYDYVQVGVNSYSYCGYALPGTSTASSGWTINRLFFSTAGTLLSSGAVANAIWNNRYSYTY